MSAEEIFSRCVQKKDGVIIARKLAELYVAIHFNADHKPYIENETDDRYLELANRFVMEIEMGLTKTNGRHAATLSILLLSEETLDQI